MPLPADHRIEFRIGINLGDIVVEDGDIFGDGVNVAARLEGLAEPGGICVSARVQEDAAGRLDLAFEDMGEQALKNIARPSAGLPGPTVAPLDGGCRLGPALPLPDKPSIAVLPFANMSGDPEQEYFVDGMVEEIITALSRIRWLFVIARNSSFTYKGQAVDVKQVGRELGVRYVLEGSVRKAGNRVRITGAADRRRDRRASVGRPLRRLARRRVRASGQDRDQCRRGDRAGIAGRGDAPLRRAADARPHRLRSLPARVCGLLPDNERSGSSRLCDCLNRRSRSIGITGRHCPGRRSATCGSSVRAGPKSRRHRRKAIDLARQALQVAENDPGILANAALVLAYFGEDIGAMIGLIDRALALNPSFARGWYRSGLLRVSAGNPISRSSISRLAAPEPARACRARR